MNHHWTHLLVSVTTRVEKIESFRKLKVELDGGALDGPPEGVLDGDIDLGAIEGAVAGVQFPTMTELVQAFRQLRFRFVPSCSVSDETIGPSGKFEIEIKSKD